MLCPISRLQADARRIREATGTLIGNDGAALLLGIAEMLERHGDPAAGLAACTEAHTLAGYTGLGIIGYHFSRFFSRSLHSLHQLHTHGG